MSHRTNLVKHKRYPRARSTISRIKTPGLVDLHFHGAFGIDVMTASAEELDHLSKIAWQKGIAGFCPTTLSSAPEILASRVEVLGKWIRQKRFPGARPLGIHLEGPFIHPMACGAHPPQTIRPFNWQELENLWSLSQETLKILTMAPEILSPEDLKKLCKWTQSRKITLSLGHSQATEAEATQAFEAGFRNVTHSWNAMRFHHREAGVMGAALGKKSIFLELILDQVHVSPTLIRWTRDLHPSQQICFISDCLPPAGNSDSNWYSFGSLQVRKENGASRLAQGSLAGGGLVLTDSYIQWLESETKHHRASALKLFKKTIQNTIQVPLQALKLSPTLISGRQIIWEFHSSGKILAIPVD